jgi:hypothetical protein
MACTLTGCRTRKVAGFELVSHADPCRYAPIGACTGCGHDIVRSEEDHHDACADL